ncbi:hypothetical protein JCM10908_005240 [Rhodotorula pacifica]|uniref:chitin synthase n=1 Tax=Rhodotorula pacifica TaxID=1495444 RepID=UPI003177CC5F
MEQSRQSRQLPPGAGPPPTRPSYAQADSSDSKQSASPFSTMDNLRSTLSPPPPGQLSLAQPYDMPTRPAPHHSSSSGLSAGAKVQFSTSYQGGAAAADALSLAEVPLVGYQYQAGGGRLHPGHIAAGTSGSRSTGASTATDFKRKKSLVRPDRERVDEHHRLYNYRQHAAAMEAEGRGTAAVSRTGHYASAGLPIPVTPAEVSGRAVGPGIAAATGGSIGAPHSHANMPGHGAGAAQGGAPGLRRGKSILAREEGMANESGLNLFKRSGTVRRRGPKGQQQQVLPGGAYEQNRKAKPKSKPMSPWMIYCQILTACLPSPLLKCFGLRTKDRRNAFREKLGLLSIIALCMTFVGFLTFGFTKVACGKPALRYRAGTVGTGSMIFHGYDYDMDRFSHPAAAGIAEGSNPLYDIFDAAAKDGSFLFQKVNQRCLDVITPAVGTGITHNGNEMGWYMPCNMFNQWGSTTPNFTAYAEGYTCHTQADARTQFADLTKSRRQGQIYFEWDDLKNSSRNLGVYDGAVLDFSLLNWLSTSQVAYPPLFDQLRTGTNTSFTGRDITTLMVNSGQRKVAECLVDVIRVGFIDSNSFGCVASDVVLYVSLVVIIGVVAVRFAFAVLFGWFVSWKIGKFPEETYEQRRARAAAIENWTDDIYRPAPARYRPSVPTKAQKKSMLPTTSRFSKGDLFKADASSQLPTLSKKGMLGAGMRNSPPGSPGSPRASRSSTSLPMSSFTLEGMARGLASEGAMGICPFPLGDVVPQPPLDYEPFNYPLAHAIMLVTAYSESVEGLRTTLDSLSTTDYPNSHKVILVIADGMVKGSGNSLTTPEIVLGMMKEFIVQPAEVEPQSYVAIADGHKRHNMAKVFAGYYDYDDNTVEKSKQQRVPMLLVAKVGNPAEQRDPKPGNRGKRDSQVLIMNFLQKVMFDERMTTFEYEFFNSLWRSTGVSPDRYEVVLMVDADTKIFPDSVSRMVACMVHDPEIMGLCGETKIANKSDSWVTMIQVFEYYVSHHQTKAFESMFGGVTCLPGCFSMYRIKAPKGGDGYWVPILANPDIVQHYSENVVDTLHTKNLLLLGEDRYLTTLMLRTFPRRKMMFCPQAVCKTIVPDTFSVLLSQRRRWINSTVHNLFELIQVPDLCGVFCFSMRFVIFMELAGTLVLPAAIAFTLYLIVVAIIPGTVKPIVSLVLLALILGMPAILIVVTSRRWAYLGWMLIYLLSLPVWNFVLPFYAYLHMDDFTWGQTRQVEGDKPGGGGHDHGSKEGTFNSSHITMKRWRDWERDRRYRSATHSRESTNGDYLASRDRPDSPHRGSIFSGTDASTVVSDARPFGSGYNLPRYPTELTLPAPLAPPSVSATSSQTSFDRPNVVAPPVPAHRASQDYPAYQGDDADEAERPILTQHSPTPQSDAPVFSAEPEYIAVPAPGHFASNNPFTNAAAAPAPVQAHPRRGVSLSDIGPVPSSTGETVRVAQRHSRRQSSNGPPPSSSVSASRSRPPPQQPSYNGSTSGHSSSSGGGGSTGQLPPGAAAPRYSHTGSS